MYNKKILEFYQNIKNDSDFNERLFAIKKETESINDPQKKLRKIINDLILPIAKEKGYNFTEKEILEYEKQIESTSLSKLNIDEISSVSGGANKFLALSLTALISAGFASPLINIPSSAMKSAETSSFASTSSSSSSSWSKLKNFKESSISFATNLTKIKYKSIGGRYDSGRLELTFNATFTGDVLLTTDDIANLLLDNSIDPELVNDVDIEICSNGRITLDKNLKNTVVLMDIDRVIKSVSIRSKEDPSTILSLIENSEDANYCLLTISPSKGALITSNDLNDLARGWDVVDINAIEVTNKGKLEFSPELEALGWKATNASSWFGNWKYAKIKESAPLTTRSSTSPSPSRQVLGEQPQIVGNMVGLRNLGNSCFLNAQFQQLYNIPHFKNAILSLLDVDPETQPTIFGLQLLFTGMQDAINGRPESFESLADLSQTAIDIMNTSPAEHIFDYRQEDSHEALIKIFDRCSTESPALSTVISEEFDIQGISTISFEGNEISSKPDTNIELSLPINKDLESQTLSDTLSRYLEPEDVEYGGGGTIAQKTFRANRLPNTLQLQFKRFAFEKSSSEAFRAVKLNNRVEFTETLNLDAQHWGEACQYRLTGVVIHSGAASGGHYYSYVKDPSSGSWYKLNDSLISHVGSFENIQEECFGGPQKTVIDGTPYTFENETNAYMLFYSRV